MLLLMLLLLLLMVLLMLLMKYLLTLVNRVASPVHARTLPVLPCAFAVRNHMLDFLSNADLRPKPPIGPG